VFSRIALIRKAFYPSGDITYVILGGAGAIFRLDGVAGLRHDVRAMLKHLSPPAFMRPFVLPLLVLALWQGSASLSLVSPRLLPGPVAVAEAGIRLTVSGQLPADIAVSTLRALVGLVIGGSVGFALGLVNGLSRRFEAFTDTTVQMARTIPHLALIPLVILWLGVGEAAKIFLVAVSVVFPIYINTLQGIRQVDPVLVEAGRIYGLEGFALFRRVLLPGALPAIFVGVRSALGIMWLTLIVAETIAATSGLGHMAAEARDLLQVDVVMLAIVLYALLGKLADSLTRMLERRLLKWHPAYRVEQHLPDR
jgi:sulfonate transport system permease protein